MDFVFKIRQVIADRFTTDRPSRQLWFYQFRKRNLLFVGRLLARWSVGFCQNYLHNTNFANSLVCFLLVKGSLI